MYFGMPSLAAEGSRGSSPCFIACAGWLVGQLIVPSNLGLSGTGQVLFSHIGVDVQYACAIYITWVFCG